MWSIDCLTARESMPVSDRLVIGGVYRHFKGNNYRVLDIAEHSETGELFVVYKALYGERKTYIRPLEMFKSPVDRDKYPDVAQKMRFEYIGESDVATLLS